MTNVWLFLKIYFSWVCDGCTNFLLVFSIGLYPYINAKNITHKTFLFRKITEYSNVVIWVLKMKGSNVLNRQWCWWPSMLKCTWEKNEMTKWKPKPKPRGTNNEAWFKPMQKWLTHFVKHMVCNQKNVLQYESTQKLY